MASLRTFTAFNIQSNLEYISSRSLTALLFWHVQSLIDAGATRALTDVFGCGDTSPYSWYECPTVLEFSTITLLALISFRTVLHTSTAVAWFWRSAWVLGKAWRLPVRTGDDANFRVGVAMTPHATMSHAAPWAGHESMFGRLDRIGSVGGSHGPGLGPRFASSPSARTPPPTDSTDRMEALPRTYISPATCETIWQGSTTSRVTNGPRTLTSLQRGVSECRFGAQERFTRAGAPSPESLQRGFPTFRRKGTKKASIDALERVPSGGRAPRHPSTFDQGSYGDRPAEFSEGTGLSTESVYWKSL